MLRDERLPRCGDHVLHGPTGETWVVAWAEGEHLAWAGWPNGTALITDCTIVKRTTDAEHRRAVEDWEHCANDDGRRERVLHLYGGILA